MANEPPLWLIVLGSAFYLGWLIQKAVNKLEAVRIVLVALARERGLLD